MIRILRQSDNCDGHWVPLAEVIYLETQNLTNEEAQGEEEVEL